MSVGPAAIPLLAALVAAALAARVGGSAVRRYSPAKLFWAVGLAAYAVAAGAEAYGAADGFGPASFRIYYLAGGCLTVAFLGAGSAWLVLPRPVALVLTGALVATAAGAAVAVLVADLAPIAGEPSLRPPPNDTLTGHAFLYAIALNVAGTALMAGASIASLVRRRRVVGNVLLLVGIVAVAGSGALTRFGSYGLVVAGQLVGIVLLAVGFELAERTAGSRRPRVRGLGITSASAGPGAS